VDTREPIDNEVDEPFNGAELSESVLARDGVLPEEGAAVSNLSRRNRCHTFREPIAASGRPALVIARSTRR